MTLRGRERADRAAVGLPVLILAGVALAVATFPFHARILAGDPAAVLHAVGFGGFAAASVVLTAIDLATHRLPDVVVLPTLAVVVLTFASAALLAGEPSRAVTVVLGAAGSFALYLGVRLASPRAMGGGDVKLAAVIGAALGVLGLPSLVIGVCAGFVLGGVAALVLLATRRATRQTAFAFGPWMLAGAWVAILLGAAAPGGMISVG